MSGVEYEHSGLRIRPIRRELSATAAKVVAATLAAVLLMAVAWGIALTRQLSGESGAGSGTPTLAAEQQARRDVQLAVSSFAANFNNYSVDDIGGYKQRMLPLMTAKFGQSFEY